MHAPQASAAVSWHPSLQVSQRHLLPVVAAIMLGRAHLRRGATFSHTGRCVGSCITPCEASKRPGGRPVLLHPRLHRPSLHRPRSHLQYACEGQWRLAFFMFMAGMPVFFVNMALAAWIKFSYSTQTAATMTAVMALSLTIFLVAQNRWCVQRGGVQGVPAAAASQPKKCKRCMVLLPFLLPFLQELAPHWRAAHRLGRGAAAATTCRPALGLAPPPSGRDLGAGGWAVAH